MISFTLSCTGCHSLVRGEDYSSRVNHAGERRTTLPKNDVARACDHIGRVGLEVGRVGVEIILVAAIIALYVAAGHSHGHFSVGHSYHH